MDQETSTVLDYLNGHSSVDWMYVPYEQMRELIKGNTSAPVCFLGFRRGNTTHADLPKDKYMLFCRKVQPKMPAREFIATHGKNLIQHMREKLGDQLDMIEHMPSLTTMNTITLFTAHEPPVESAEVKLTYDLTLTCLNSNISDIMDLEMENNKELKLKFEQTYNNILSSFSLKLDGTDPIWGAGVSSSILGDHVTSKVLVSPYGVSPKGQPEVKVEAENKFNASYEGGINGLRWKVEGSIGYQLEAIVDIDMWKRTNRLTPFQLKMKALQPMMNNAPIGFDGRQIAQSSWWDRHGTTVVHLGEGAAFVVLLGTVVFTAGATLPALIEAGAGLFCVGRTVAAAY